MTSEPKVLCVLFADVSGSTRLYEKLGDADALRAVELCIERMCMVTQEGGGRIVKTIGDEVMAVFDSAPAGMSAACTIQQQMDALPPLGGQKLGVRIGFHYGPVLIERQDCFGDTVNIAARMVGLAKSGQILTTNETIAALPPSLRESARDLDAVPVKGKAEAIRIFEVIWHEQADLTMIATRTSRTLTPAGRLVLSYQGAVVTLDAKGVSLAVGRDATNEVVVTGKQASRQHARFERRRDKFVLIDQSTNGTYVRFDGEEEIVLRREEAILRGRGLVGFGASIANCDGDVLEFEVSS